MLRVVHSAARWECLTHPPDKQDIVGAGRVQPVVQVLLHPKQVFTPASGMRFLLFGAAGSGTRLCDIDCRSLKHSPLGGQDGKRSYCVEVSTAGRVPCIGPWHCACYSWQVRCEGYLSTYSSKLCGKVAASSLVAWPHVFWACGTHVRYSWAT